LWYLQVLSGNEYENSAQATQTRSVKMPAQRGVIYDRNGTVLANNQPGLNVTIIPNAIPREKVEKLADVRQRVEVRRRKALKRILFQRVEREKRDACGSVVFILLAGLASIPAEVEDAAKVDGATGLKKFWYVTLPLQLPIATVALLFGIVFTATDMTVVYILTHGGPFNSTHMLTTWAFDTGINSAALGQGAAISLYLLPALALVAILMLSFARKVEVT
jgi:hypothetical protein